MSKATLHICDESCFPWSAAYWAPIMEEMEREYNRELDMARELELDPFEEATRDDIEYVPLYVALSWRD